MARLILLNGAPGVGKSTIGRRLVDEWPLALLLDVDVVRSWLGDDGPDVTASFLATRALALAMAGTHLRAGHDVVVPQYLGLPDFLGQIEDAAAGAGAEFVELVLATDAGTGRARFDTRGEVPQLVGARESWEQMHARLAALLTTRPRAVVVDASGGVDATLAAVRAVLQSGSPGVTDG